MNNRNQLGIAPFAVGFVLAAVVVLRIVGVL